MVSAPRRRYRYLNSANSVFAAIVLLLAVWIGSGMIGRDDGPAAERAPAGPPTVAVSLVRAREVTRELVLYGDIEPNQRTALRARTDGIVERMTDTGVRVARGEMVGRLSSDDREARLARARARLSAAQRDYDSASGMAESGYVSRSEMQTRRADLEAAKAELRAIELEIENTTLRAPIDGVIEAITADLGAYVASGGEVLRIVDNDPLIAVVHVHQTSAPQLHSGMAARVDFLGGGSREGRIRFIAPVADAATRTFRVEVEVGNSDLSLPSGMSAEVVIPVETLQAHRVSPALIQLDAQGRIGLQTVTDDDRIAFMPVEVVRARDDGIWVTGLPESVRLVTISRGMLSPGQLVTVRETPAGYAEPAGAD